MKTRGEFVALNDFIESHRNSSYFSERQIEVLNYILDQLADSLEGNCKQFENLFNIMSPNDLVPAQFTVPGYSQLEERLQNLAVRVRQVEKARMESEQAQKFLSGKAAV